MIIAQGGSFEFDETFAVTCHSILCAYSGYIPVFFSFLFQFAGALINRGLIS